MLTTIGLLSGTALGAGGFMWVTSLRRVVPTNIVHDESGVIGKSTLDETVNSIRSNLKSCDWLTKEDLKFFIHRLEELL